MTFKDVWPVVLLAISIVQSLLLYSFRASIRIAILELRESLADKYATKDDVRRLEVQIELGKKVDNGFASLLRTRSGDPAAGRS